MTDYLISTYPEFCLTTEEMFCELIHIDQHGYANRNPLMGVAVNTPYVSNRKIEDRKLILSYDESKPIANDYMSDNGHNFVAYGDNYMS